VWALDTAGRVERELVSEGGSCDDLRDLDRADDLSGALFGVSSYPADCALPGVLVPALVISRIRHFGAVHINAGVAVFHHPWEFLRCLPWVVTGFPAASVPSSSRMICIVPGGTRFAGPAVSLAYSESGRSAKVRGGCCGGTIPGIPRNNRDWAGDWLCSVSGLRPKDSRVSAVACGMWTLAIVGSACGHWYWFLSFFVRSVIRVGCRSCRTMWCGCRHHDPAGGARRALGPAHDDRGGVFLLLHCAWIRKRCAALIGANQGNSLSGGIVTTSGLRRGCVRYSLGACPTSL